MGSRARVWVTGYAGRPEGNYLGVVEVFVY